MQFFLVSTLLLKVYNLQWHFYIFIEHLGVVALTFQYDLMDLGVLIYRQFYSEEKESLQGVIGIHVLSPPEEKQPLAIVGSMLQVIVSLPKIVI